MSQVDSAIRYILLIGLLVVKINCFFIEFYYCFFKLFILMKKTSLLDRKHYDFISVDLFDVIKYV